MSKQGLAGSSNFLSRIDIVNYLPGLIFLFFCMLALHTSLRVMKEHAGIFDFYRAQSNFVLTLKEKQQHLHNAILTHMENPDAPPANRIREAFNDLANAYFVHSDYAGLIKNDHHNYNYASHLHALDSELIDLSRLVGADLAGLSDLRNASVELGRGITQAQNLLHQTVFSDDRYNEIAKLERLQYWSIIILGMAGFLLLLLNTDKLGKLRKMNEEKRRHLVTMEERVAAMEATNDGIVIVGDDCNITYVNNSLCRLQGRQGEEYKVTEGQNWLDLFSTYNKNDFEKKILLALKKEGHWQGEYPVAAEYKTALDAELSLTALPGGGFVGIVRDVTSSRRAVREKEELQTQFYQAQKMEAIGRLAGGIAHDFNNILAAMNGYAEFLIEDLQEGSDQKDFAQKILQAGKQAKSLVDQMLAFSRRKDGVSEVIDLTAPVRECMAMLEASIPKTIEVNASINVDRALVKSNATQISQVIMNLCVNARDAMEEDRGRIDIRIDKIDPEQFSPYGIITDDLPDPDTVPATRVHDVEPGRTRLFVNTLSAKHKYICLTVADTGSGMGRVVMERVFEPFFTTKPVDKGTGLGLPTVHGVITGNRGAIIIDSKVGQGTEFNLFLPVLEEDVLPEQVKSTEMTANLNGMVLLVEDQAEVQDMMETMLSRIGFDVSVCHSGMEALAVIRENPGAFDLVITDQNMPKMTGLELIYQLQQEGLAENLPFIMISGYSEEKLQDYKNENNAIKAILRKPVDRETLSRKIHEVLSEARDAKNAEGVKA